MLIALGMKIRQGSSDSYGFISRFLDVFEEFFILFGGLDEEVFSVDDLVVLDVVVRLPEGVLELLELFIDGYEFRELSLEVFASEEHFF